MVNENWLALTIVLWIFSLGWALLALREAREDAERCRQEWYAWEKACIRSLKTWVKYEWGEWGEKEFHNFSRYNPPDYVRDCLPVAPNKSKKKVRAETN